MDEGCCGVGGIYKGVIFCFSLFKLCFNCFDYFFWDLYYFIDKVNVVLFVKFWLGIGYIWFVNV